MSTADEALSQLLSGAVDAASLTPDGRALLVRAIRHLATAVSVASDDLLTRAIASQTAGDLSVAISDLLLLVPSSVGDPSRRAYLRGRISIRNSVEAAGGAWSENEAAVQLRVTRATLDRWLDDRQVLRFELSDRSFLYPIAQFELRSSEAGARRPHPAVATVLKIVGDTLTMDEVVALMTSQQPMLSGSDGNPRTPFQAIAGGDERHVYELVRWVVAPSDLGAPVLKERDVRFDVLTRVYTDAELAEIDRFKAKLHDSKLRQAEGSEKE